MHFNLNPEKGAELFIFRFFACVCVCGFIYRETDVKGQTSFSKCQMYDVNWTTIQSGDYEDWNLTRHHEKLNVLGKYWQVTKQMNNKNKKKIKQTKKKKKLKKATELQKITFALSAHCNS